jgi:hypothetical protein
MLAADRGSLEGRCGVRAPAPALVWALQWKLGERSRWKGGGRVWRRRRGVESLMMVNVVLC